MTDRGSGPREVLPSDNLVPIDRLSDALVDPGYDRDEVSILGGEPPVS